MLLQSYSALITFFAVNFDLIPWVKPIQNQQEDTETASIEVATVSLVLLLVIGTITSDPTFVLRL